MLVRTEPRLPAIPDGRKPLEIGGLIFAPL
jgi:hypothetical protein